MDQTSTIVDLKPAKHLNAHHWTNEEKVFRRKARIAAEIKHLDIPLQTALRYKLGKSVFGCFLKELNSGQYQDYFINDDKAEILQWHLKRYNAHDKAIIQKRNNVTNDCYKLLQIAVKTREVIDTEYLTKRLESLYLDGCFIKQIDNALQRFEHIKILTLCGNYIKDLPGNLLPRKLLFLELFDNFISDLSNLIRQAPRSLLHLGLGRNRLSDDSSLHLLAKSNTLHVLKSLDLSDNDICSLEPLVKRLEKLTNLTALSLEGNPCSIVPKYKSAILKQLPHLKYLDATEILDTDRNAAVPEHSQKYSSSYITFKCYRIMGLPEPPKDKKNNQTIHIEVNFPLLVDNLKNTDEISIAGDHNLEMKEENTNKTTNKETNKSKSGKGKDATEKKNAKSKNGKSSKTPKKKSYYSGENEYNEKVEDANVWFKSARMNWAKTIEFPVMEIESPKSNLTTIRDTFRSIVPIRIVYLKIAPYSANAKKKAKEKKSKKDKSIKVSEETADVKPENQIIKEIILKKLVIASFYCELKSLNWSDETLDFYWADIPVIGQKAIRVEGSLMALEYDATARPRKAKKNKTTEINEPSRQPLPTALTCQVGFGLNREVAPTENKLV